MSSFVNHYEAELALTEKNLQSVRNELASARDALHASKLNHYPSSTLVDIGSVPSEIKWSYPASEMPNFLDMLKEAEFRNAPYWKYCSVLQASDVDALSLYGEALGACGMY
jgi:hypothetical protein